MDQDKIIKYFLENFMESRVYPMVKLVKFWKWTREDRREFIQLTALVLICTLFFFYKGYETQCTHLTGGGLGYYQDKDYGFFKPFKPECIPGECFHNKNIKDNDLCNAAKEKIKELKQVESEGDLFSKGIYKEKNYSIEFK